MALRNPMVAKVRTGSREDIITAAGVVVAITGVVIAVTGATPPSKDFAH